MNINESLLQKSEKLIFALRELYSQFGYAPYRMSKFEEYDLYARNKDFLVSDNVITFTDANGKLMALKPDVTLSIIKNSTDNPDEIQKVYYNENVYRTSSTDDSFREIMQSGVECFGRVDDEALASVILLAARSIVTTANSGEIAVSDLSFIEEAILECTTDTVLFGKLLHAIGEKNTHEIKSICADGGIADKKAELLARLALVHCGIADAKSVLGEISGYFPNSENLKRFIKITKMLSSSEESNMITVDFSIVGDVNYYNGVVFKGYVKGIPGDVLSGGQYDKLMRKVGRKSDAVGFAVYLDKLDRYDAEIENAKCDSYLNVALPKGRLGEKVYAIFAEAGFECPSILEPNRKLIFENAETKVRYFWVKPSDVAIYVERGAADIGVAGKDILLEYKPDVYELCDLDMGKCRMAVAAQKDFKDNPEATLRVATKFSDVAKAFYLSKGRDIDIIHLNGSIEIAPILGLSDVIVDIVETGSTLRENNLEVVENIFPISARLISNKTAFRFKKEQIERVVCGIEKRKESKND